MTKIFISAGEPSGDNIGAKLIMALREFDPDIEISIIGGKKMEALGLKSIFDIEPLSVMGLIEVLPKIKSIKQRLKLAYEHIIAFKPDVIITIDSFGFHKRLIKSVQELKSKSLFCHYVAPQVWAHGMNRIYQVKALYHRVFCILPFEVKLYKDLGINATFVGHPALDDVREPATEQELKAWGFNPHKPILVVMPGSRAMEIKRLGRVFSEAADRFVDTHGYNLFIPTLPHLEPLIKTYFKKGIISSTIPKGKILETAKLALIKSGTSSMEMILHEVPHVVAYKAHPITYMFYKQLVAIKYMTLANIVMDKMIFPEYLQADCTAENLFKGLEAMHNAKSFDLDIFSKVKRAFRSNKPSAKKVVDLIYGLKN